MKNSEAGVEMSKHQAILIIAILIVMLTLIVLEVESQNKIEKLKSEIEVKTEMLNRNNYLKHDLNAEIDATQRVIDYMVVINHKNYKWFVENREWLNDIEWGE